MENPSQETATMANSGIVSTSLLRYNVIEACQSLLLCVYPY